MRTCTFLQQHDITSSSLLYSTSSSLPKSSSTGTDDNGRPREVVCVAIAVVVIGVIGVRVHYKCNIVCNNVANRRLRRERSTLYLCSLCARKSIPTSVAHKSFSGERTRILILL